MKIREILVMIYRWLVTFSDLCASGGEMAGPSGGLVPHFDSTPHFAVRIRYFYLIRGHGGGLVLHLPFFHNVGKINIKLLCVHGP
jgi:hypothetical protein